MSGLRKLSQEEIEALGLAAPMQPEQPEQIYTPEVSGDEAERYGAAQMMTGGLLDEAGSAIDTAGDFIGQGNLNPEVQDVLARYREVLGENRAELGAAEEQHPDRMNMGRVAGTAVPALGAAAKVAPMAARGAQHVAGALKGSRLGGAMFQTAKEQIPGAVRDIASTSTTLKSLGSVGKFAKGVAGHMKDPKAMSGGLAAGSQLPGVKGQLQQSYQRQLREKNTGTPAPVLQDASQALDWITQNVSNPYYAKQAMQGVLDEPTLSRKIVQGLSTGLGVPGLWPDEEEKDVASDEPPSLLPY